ncbi:MAG: helicase C-terminal domain-containing protein [candidate division WOR-3 bacterium]
MEKIINAIFSDTSILSTILNNYEVRNEQKEMALAVYNALQNQEKLFVEAGTGVGKSLAYLIPIALWILQKNEKAVITTYTKILQNQLIKKDIKILNKTLDLLKLFEARCIKSAVVFGQENYVCRRRLANVNNYGLFDSPTEKLELDEFGKWLADSESGIILEYQKPLGLLAEKICRDSDNCKFKKCHYYENCYYFKARKEWLNADLLIINHALFFANVTANFSIIPKFDAVVFDEAHRLEEVIADFFGLEISNFGIHRLLNSIFNSAKNSGLISHFDISDLLKREITKLINQAHQSVDAMFLQFASLISAEQIKLRIKKPLAIENTLADILAQLINILLETTKENTDEDLAMELKILIKRLEYYHRNIDEFLKVEDQNSVYWIETIPSSKKQPLIYLRTSLIDVSEVFQKYVADNIPTMIFSSATLTVSKDFSFIKNRLGFNNTKTLLLYSPFDYSKQALLYIPTNLPMPTDEDKFLQSCANIINKILDYSNGRALILFTSYQALEKTYHLVEKKEFRFLVQGQESVFELLNKFINDVSSVLFATQSFWQGIDVPGEALSCLIIVRLPFDVPDEPRLEGICEQLRRNGQEPFLSYQLPNAVLKFRQGFGRLIRNKQDRGVVCVLDKRIVLRKYGKQFIDSLPQNLPITFSIESIKNFFANQLV